MSSTKKFIPAILWFMLLLFLICLPGNQIPEHNPFLEKIFFDKWVHLGLFGILSMLCLYPLGSLAISQNLQQQWAIKICLACIMWGLTTEYIQKYFIPFRSFDLADWAADSVGVICAYFIWLKLQKLPLKIKKVE